MTREANTLMAMTGGLVSPEEATHAVANDAEAKVLLGRCRIECEGDERAVMVGPRGAVVGVNAGDSRIYGLTRSRGVEQLSRDDNVAELLGQPGGYGANQLVQFVGMGDGIAPRIIDVGQNEFESILITSDGVHCASPATFAQVVRAPTDNHGLTRRLLALNDALGGHDNGTAVVLPIPCEAPDSDSEQGLNLTFWSPWDRLEIWIPAL